MFDKLLSLIPGGVPAALAIAFAIGLSSGAGGVLAWEHKSPMGLGHKLTAANDKLANARREVAGWKINRQGWVDYADALEKARTNDNDKATSLVTACSNSSDDVAQSAYQNGVTAGVVLGRRQCGAPNATPSLPAGRPAAGGVREPIGPDPVFGGGSAYVPASPVPAHR